MIDNVKHLTRPVEDDGHQPALKLGDFTANRDMIRLSVLALGIGIISAFVAYVLLVLINLLINLLYFGRWDISTKVSSAAGNHLGWYSILIPIGGGLLIGLMAKYGSEQIRGHGIPEAIEAILIDGSRVKPKVALWKPISSAVSIGTGGPFGAEGPIILTGGAFGSLIAQFFNLTSAERKTLLCAGAAGGMAATFGTPVAAMTLAAELLLFELKPRSLVPVAIASAAAAFMRHYLIGGGALFPNFADPGFIGVIGILLCVVTGFAAGFLSAILTAMVYAAEDAFTKLPIHWMWWPAIGGVVVGIGGMIYPPALSVGYDVIRTMLAGDITTKMILGVLLVKSVMWAVALGSGTSGGVLAPLLMMGGALGGLEGLIFPNFGSGFWPLIAMAAILGGTMRVPITAVIFALELTHNVGLLLPLLVAASIAHGVTVLIMKRSILTEKISRRGYHLSREYSVDPLEIIFVREVMRTDIVALRPDLPVSQVTLNVDRPLDRKGPSQGLYPVINADDELVGVVTRTDLAAIESAPHNGHEPLVKEIAQPDPVVAHPDEPLRIVAYRMAATGLTRFPVVDRSNHAHLVGMVAFGDLLYARERVLNEERRRERVLRLRFFNWGKPGTPQAPPSVTTTLKSKAPGAKPETEERLPAGSSSLK